jgi:AraC-like DNA-binding protein
VSAKIASTWIVFMMTLDQYNCLAPSCLGSILHPTVKASTIPASAMFGPARSLSVDAGLLEQLFDQAPDIAFFIKDAAGRYKVVNHSLVERNGLKEKNQLINRRPCDLVPGELGRSASDQDAEILRGGHPLINHLELHWRAPNRPVWCLTTKLPMHDADGQVCGLVGISRDLSHPIATAEIPPGVAKALEHLAKHYDEPVSPVLLSRRAGLSAPRFARLVKRIFGITPTQLITKTRVAAAAELLRDTDQSIAEVALACGFCDHSAFTRAYHSATGQTPREFRRVGRGR